MPSRRAAEGPADSPARRVRTPAAGRAGRPIGKTKSAAAATANAQLAEGAAAARSTAPTSHQPEVAAAPESVQAPSVVSPGHQFIVVEAARQLDLLVVRGINKEPARVTYSAINLYHHSHTHKRPRNSHAIHTYSPHTHTLMQAFVKGHLNSRVLVFVATEEQADLYAVLLSSMRLGASVVSSTGNATSGAPRALGAAPVAYAVGGESESIAQAFCARPAGVMFTTDRIGDR